MRPYRQQFSRGTAHWQVLLSSWIGSRLSMTLLLAIMLNPNRCNTRCSIVVCLAGTMKGKEIEIGVCEIVRVQYSGESFIKLYIL